MKLTLKDDVIPSGATVIVGVSGGRDSMGLVHALQIQRPDLQIIAAHLNHGLRDDADDDASFVEAIMQRWKIECEVYKPRAKEAGNTENWGREKRYDFFEKLRKKYRSEWILTAHHQDDDFESMLLAFLRGTRVKGLSGMLLQKENVYRPLLFTPRSEINEYCQYHEVHYREDPSNEDERYARNFLRHQVIPVLNHVYPEMAARWQKQKDYWLDLQDMLETSAETFMENFLTDEGMNRDAYRSLPFPIRATVLELWFKESADQRIADNLTLLRWDEAILNWPSRKKTEWDEGRFLTVTKTHARVI